MRKLTYIFLILLSSNFVFGQFGIPNDISRSSPEPVDVLNVDIDGDLDDDIITYSRLDGKLALYINTNGLNFSNQQILAIKLGGERIHNADIDNDGDDDFLIALPGDNEVGWFENFGGLKFSEYKSINSSINGASDVYAADLDNDGDKDIIACSIIDKKIVWHQNNGNGIFGSEQVIFTSINSCWSISADDVNNDGKNDVVCGTADKLFWFENLGSGVFGSQNILQNYTSSNNKLHYIHLVDIDNDSFIDIVNVHSKNYTVGWYKNNGLGSFTYNHIGNYIGAARSVNTGDIDNDGIHDVYLTSQNETVWFKNTGGGSFLLNKNIIANGFNYGMASKVSDFDQDGDNDLVNVSIFDNKVGLYENLGSGSFASEKIISQIVDGVRSVFASDIDNDGLSDVISASENDNKIAYYKNLGNGIYDKQIILSDSIPQPRNIISTDIDNDSNEDILVVSNGEIVWFRNLGMGNFTSEISISKSFPSGCEIKTSDLDNDGDLDVLASNKNGSNSGKIVWFENLGGSIIDTNQKIILSNLSGYVSINPQNIDGDSFIDIVFSSIGNNTLGWIKNLGNGTFNTTYNYISLVNDPHSIFTADLDNDGDFDILTAYNSSFSSGIKLSINSGTGVFTNGVSLGFSDARDVYCIDVNSDGNIDVIGGTDQGINNNFSIGWYENLGFTNFNFNKNVIHTNSGDGILNIGGGFLHSSDLDNDGDKDILFANEYDDKITWFENFYFSPYQLKGNLYYDANQNKVKDTNEIGLSFIQMQIQPTGQSCYTSATGEYIFAPDTGSYMINYVPNTFWNLTTDSVSYNRTLTGISPLADSLDFGFFPDTIFTSIQADLTGAFPRCNETINYWVDIHNKGTTLPSGIIHLQLDDSIAFVSATILPDSIVGQNIYWSYDSLNFYSNFDINIQVTMPPFTSMGDTLTSYLTVHELDGLGNIIYTNSDSLQQVSVCAYDPNDKSVLPKGIGVEGYIPNNEPFLEYLIRFQNTGNDTAITVMVRDQLDSNLDWNSMQIISSSHIMQAWIEQDGEAVFKFENIMLPDSGADFNGSQGYIKFRINLSPNIISGTQILNTSHIYFDNNPAVITNTTINTIYDCGNALVNVINSPTCLGENLIANSPEGSIINYFWEIESFYSDSSSTLCWQSDTVGTFNLKLTVNNPFCSKDTTTSITIYPALPITNTSQSICQGDSVQIGGLFYSTQGVYSDTLQSYLGCDSILSINLSIDSNYISNQNQSICQGDSILIFGTYQNTAGLYYDSLQAINGCDSVLSVTLNISPDIYVNYNQSICQGDSILLYGNYESVAGIYYDSLQTINGCDSVLSTTLTIDSLPNVFLSSFNPDTLCDNGSLVSLPIGTPSGGNYSGNGISGGNFNPASAGIGSHQIIYTYTDSNSCVNSDTTIVTVNSCVGIDEQVNDFGILIYPNPNTGLFTIEKPKGLNEEVKVKLLDATSKLILDKIILQEKQQLEIDITNYSNGVYYLQLIVGEEVFVKQILKN